MSNASVPFGFFLQKIYSNLSNDKRPLDCRRRPLRFNRSSRPDEDFRFTPPLRKFDYDSRASRNVVLRDYSEEHEKFAWKRVCFPGRTIEYNLLRSIKSTYSIRVVILTSSIVTIAFDRIVPLR